MVIVKFLVGRLRGEIQTGPVLQILKSLLLVKCVDNVIIMYTYLIVILFSVQGVIDSSKNAHTWITTASLTGLSVDQNTHKVYSIGYELESGEEVTPDLYPASAALISSTEALKSVVKTRCSGNVRDCLTIDRLELFKAISAQLDSLRIEPDINQVPSFLKLNRLGVLEFQDGVKLNQGINGQKAIIYEAQLLTANTAPQVSLMNC